MRINHNISAIKANSILGRNNTSLEKSLERLSSGLRINRAADDAAGMAISQKMKTQIAGLEQASRNAADGISVIQTAEGALSEVGAMLQRMRELAVQSANGTNTAEDRAAIQAEINNLNEEIQRISDTTEFNTKTLLNGDIDRKSYSSNSNVRLISLSDAVDVKDYNITITQDARQAVLLGASGTGETTPITAAQAGKININGEDIEINEGDTIEDIYQKLRDLGDLVNVAIVPIADGTTGPTGSPAIDYVDTAGYEADTAGYTGTNRLLFVSKEYGTAQTIEINCDNSDLAARLGLGSGKITATGVDAIADIPATNSGFTTTATVSAEGNVITITDRGGFEMKFEAAPYTVGTTFTDSVAGAPVAVPTGGTPVTPAITVLDAGPMSLQIGANEGQIMEVRIPKVTPKTLGIDNINLGTEAGAQKAIAALSDAVNMVSGIRAKLGAYQNRLEHSIANLDVSAENITEALSRIEDTDMAEEMANYTQYQVLTQAGTSMLAQANERPQNVLTLLQG